MSQSVADIVKDRCRVVAVSDAYKLAPWADVLVSADKAWWRHHAPSFKGIKLSAAPAPGAERFADGITGENSGLLAVRVAVSMGATRVLLLGCDMHGSHYFGPHPEGLKNTSAKRQEVFKLQFARYQPRGVEILNCTPGSGLNCYPMSSLDACLA